MRLDYDHLCEALRDRHPSPSMDSGLRPAAVMLLLVDRPETHLLLIQKTLTEGYPWSGQIALPGGMIHTEDSTPLAAAVREVEEELGIDAAALRILGYVGPFRTQITAVEVHAFAARWSGGTGLTPDRREVAEVFEVDLDRLLSSRSTDAQDERSTDLEIRFGVEGRTIWGLTARMLEALLQVLRRPVRT